MLQAGYADVECGYTLEADGSARLAILTPMPQVTPLMWHWWFGWHGDQDNKYKLWHPPAHVSTVWADDVVGKVTYRDNDGGSWPRDGRQRLDESVGQGL